MKELQQRFNEVRDKVPFDRLSRSDGQTLYGNVMDWCRDYFNTPKDGILAYMLVGWWYTRKEIEFNAKHRK